MYAREIKNIITVTTHDYANVHPSDLMNIKTCACVVCSGVRLYVANIYVYVCACVRVCVCACVCVCVCVRV